MEFSQISIMLDIQQPNADSLIWTKKSIESQNNNNKQKLDSFKKSDKINRNQLLSYIKPDYGSLGQFMMDLNLNTDFLRQKKKKNDGQQEAEERRIKQYLQNKNLNKVLSNNQSSQQQRSIACKMLIQKSFQQAFGKNINQFYQQQIQKSDDQKKGNLNLKVLSDALDQIANKSQKQKNQKNENGVFSIKQNLRKSHSFLRDNTCFRNQKEDMMKRIMVIKNSYRSLNKYNFPESPPLEYKQLTEKYSSIKSEKKQNQNHNRQSSQSSSTSNKNIMFKTFQGKVFINNSLEFCLNNLYEISIQSILFAIINQNFQTLQSFTILNTTFFNAQLLLMLLDIIFSFCKNLKVLILEDLQQMLPTKMMEKISQKIKNIIEKSSQSLQVIKLNKLGIQTKDFCLLCLGVGSTKKLEVLELKNNKIQQTGRKSYDVITKFFKNMQINLEGNPIQNQINKLGKAKSTKTLGK